MSAIIFASCTNPQEKLRKEITTHETKLRADSSMVPDTALALQLIKEYITYADQFQDDTLSPEYLFRGADLAAGTGHFSQSIQLFNRIARYPNYQKYPTSLFLKAFVTETRLGDTAVARKYYEEFLDKYPHHKLAEDARVSIRNMALSPEELVKQFESRIADSTSVTK